MAVSFFVEEAAQVGGVDQVAIVREAEAVR
jgi:hypothetical protein